MKIEIINERKNPLLNRREIRFRVSYEGATPRATEIRKRLISTLKSEDKLTILDGINPEFGRQIASGYVKVYADEESMAIEPEHRIKKNLEAKEERPEGESEGEKSEGVEKKEKSKDTKPESNGGENE
ncbi:MAG: 30S ribosomal protein S24e [Candidatus Altiarchaeales archaeon ex4484_43]|nr:MAG: 30S ribosomal protein S24e [Candidatus Altiarchaeales archaeon ex4484_43]